jgi:DNA primase
MTTCAHAYVIPRGQLLFCLHCKKFVEVAEPKEEQPLVMPPRIFEITEGLWKIITPWPLISATLAVKYGWYASFLNGRQYLVMPIFRNGVPVYYSARLLGEGQPAYKYLYPTGVKKLYWTSSDALEDPIIICEGVADAVYCSSIGSSIAVLGSYYNGSLDDKLAGHHVALVLDGDAPGILAAMTIKQNLKNVKSVKVVILPGEKDPTDFEVCKLREIVYG